MKRLSKFLWKWANHVMMLVALVLISVGAVSTIGDISKPEAYTWEDAALAVLLFTAVTEVGYQAGREREDNDDD